METAVDEIEFIRSPFYELSKAYKMNFEEVDDLMETIALKHAMMVDIGQMGLLKY